MSSFNNNYKDNYLLQTLMGRLSLRSPSINNPLITQSLEDFLFNDLDDDDTDIDIYYEGKSELVKEEAKLEREIIKIVRSGNTDSLLPNSGQAVSVRDHHICVGFHDDTESDYRVWEWHGHIMVDDDEYGYSPEYTYGNYFQRLAPGAVRGGRGSDGAEAEEEKEKEKDKAGNLGLRELIDAKDSNEGRILHRNMNAGSSKRVGAREKRVKP